MGYILKITAFLFMLMFITKAYMIFANYVGEQLGFATFFIHLLKKVRRSK